MVLIGSARINENGMISGGAPGDQTGRECATDEWYLHQLGWYVARAKDPKVREKIAQNMEYICANDNIGYDQPRDQSLYRASQPYGFDASKVTVKCDTDCARAIRVCVLYAGIDCPDFYTATEIKTLEKTGAFDILKDEKYCNSPDYLLRGDILCTRSKGHTAAVLNNGDKVKPQPQPGPAPVPTPVEPYVIANCKSCNMRTGPSTDYSIIKVLYAGNEVGLLGWADTGWGHVQYGNSIGYVSPKYLEPAQRDETEWITTAKTRLRQRPGTQWPTLKIIPKDTLLKGDGNSQKVLGKMWYCVEYDGVWGWTSEKYLLAVK